MPNNLKFVLDTNVIISALLIKHSLPRQAYDQAFHIGKILISTSTITELNDVLLRPSFKKYLQEDERIQFLSSFLKEIVLINIVEKVSECRDSKDNKFLELAINGKASCIISGDKDLLILHSYRGIPIMTPYSFLQYRWKSDLG